MAPERDKSQSMVFTAITVYLHRPGHASSAGEVSPVSRYMAVFHNRYEAGSQDSR
jgi:hypothetical protein